MTDFDSIWRTQDEIRTVVNAVLGECIWNLSYNERRMAISLSASKVTCIAVAVAWCVVCQGVVCNTVTLVNFHGSLWVMRSWCRMVHSWSMVRSYVLVHVSIV